ncbi:MAG TPA: hypothetical protein PKC76_08425 [Saprospiraceae bacterium]|nr:hypothetical protein [Saprospiraceae bacterium]HMP24142.1 hypothetical protein [Saprospiraceae bacterium]
MKIVYLKVAVYTLLLALSANVLWLLELANTGSSDDGEWISQLHYSVFVIALLAVMAYVLPFRWLHRIPWMPVGQAILEIYPATLVAFFLSKTILFSIYTRLYGYLNGNLLLALLVLVVLLISFSIHFVTKKNLRPVRWGHVFFVATGIISTVPFSILTARFLPEFSGGSTFVDAVRMGYPYGWIVLMMGLLGTRTALWEPASEEPETQDHILDDLPEED